MQGEKVWRAGGTAKFSLASVSGREDNGEDWASLVSPPLLGFCSPSNASR